MTTSSSFLLSLFLLLSTAGVHSGGAWGSCGQVEMVGDLLNLPVLLSFLSPFPSLPLLIPSPITLPPSAPWLPSSVVRDAHWMGVWSSEKRTKDEHGTNRLKHRTWPFGLHFWKWLCNMWPAQNHPCSDQWNEAWAEQNIVLCHWCIHYFQNKALSQDGVINEAHQENICVS